MNKSNEPCLRERLDRHEHLYGLFCSTPSTLVLELIANAGYDFVILDLEHTLTSAEQMDLLILTAKASGIHPLVRVPPNSPEWVVKVLDAGAEGVVFPRVRTAAQAETLSRLCRYSPEGDRGLNAHRHVRFGTEPLVPAMQRINSEVLVIVMIEDKEGVANAPSIANVAGIDVLLEGAADLSQSLELPWQTRHPIVKQHIDQIFIAAKQAGKHFCALPREVEDQQQWLEAGITMQIIGDDRGIIRRGFTSHLETFVSAKS